MWYVNFFLHQRAIAANSGFILTMWYVNFVTNGEEFYINYVVCK